MHRFSIVSILIVLTLLLGACAPAAPTPTAAPAISVKDGLGRDVQLTAPAKKIISLAPSNTEILFALNAGSQVIGRDEFSDTPVEAKKITSVGGNMGKYNLEEIARLQPDLVLASSLNTPEQIKALENLKLTVYVLTNPSDLTGIYTNLESIGKIVGREAEAKTLNSALKARVKAVEEAVAKTTSKPKVFYELDGSEPAKPWTAGAGTFIDMLIKQAGGVNAAGAVKDYAQISQEVLLVENPDLILLGDAAYGITAEQVKARAGWGSIKAVKEGKIIAFDDNLVSRPGPRLVDGLVELAKLIHPEIAASLK